MLNYLWSEPARSEGVIYSEQRICFNKLLTIQDAIQKYIDAVINSTAKYIWIMGDSNYMDIPTFSEKAYDYIKQEYHLLQR